VIYRDVKTGWDDPSAERVAVGSLLSGDSPRLAGENNDHARALAESDVPLPPIVVQRSTMRVIDGMHRLRAAVIRGQTEISVRFYDGDDEGAFILAVEANVTHGLPLSRADRIAAAARILNMRPDWSDRKIASIAGLGATTVGGIRKRLTERSGQLNTSVRVGRDGKVRSFNAVEGRVRASELIKNRPEAPIREIATAAGISPATALDVRRRLRAGVNPVPERQRSTQKVETGQPRDQPAGWNKRASQVSRLDWRAILQELKKDPSLRFTESGRALLRWLDFHTAGAEQWKQHSDSVPTRSMATVVELARRNSIAWRRIAQHLEGKIP
jgi:ParB-like chromosome segregation protein Spo0J